MVDQSGTELLKKARLHYDQKDIAKILDVSARTVARWENGEVRIPHRIGLALNSILKRGCSINSGFQEKKLFTFIDLFAGIGGIRMGFERCGGKCIFTSEWDRYSQKTYQINFSDEHSISGDITQISEEDVPNHDVLLAGFPCQPFSIAGVSKKNALGRPHGFECTTQGTLFFDIARIIAKKRPKAFLLENVKNLLSHDQGNTFRIICETLRDQLGYEIHFKIINAKLFVPQHRERIIIVGFNQPTNFSWNHIPMPESTHELSNILHPEDGSEHPDDKFTFGTKAKVHQKYTLTNKLWEYLQNYAKKHRSQGNGFGYGLVDRHEIARTLSARYYKDGSEILVNQGLKKNPRRLTPRECARLMGFPDTYILDGVSDTQLYRQFGNSVVVPLIQHVALLMVPHISKLRLNDSLPKELILSKGLHCG